MSTDDKLKIVASAALRTLFCARKVGVPISSFDLLARVISSGPPPAGLLPGPDPTPTFRLTDLAQFERILESLAQGWDFGRIVVSRDEVEGLTVLDVQLGQAHRSLPEELHGRKRKRVVDEDADSAAGDPDDDEERSRSRDVARKPAPTTLDSLSKELKEVYALLQRGTARGRLLAEQVCEPFRLSFVDCCSCPFQFRTLNSGFEPICPNITKEDCLKARRAITGDPAATICDCVHFRPLIRPHTDPTLGHCSYLNTCYSEPTYAQSPSIPPLPSHRPPHGYGAQGQSAVTLPSGLGAGGRGKEKAPCRYLHFEVDWDGNDGSPTNDRSDGKKKPYKLGIGLGPTGKENSVVSYDTLLSHSRPRTQGHTSSPLSG